MGDNCYKSSAGRQVMPTGEAAQAGIGALEDPPDRHWPSVADDEPTLHDARMRPILDLDAITIG
jgi:hypothetical protein